MLDVIGVGFGRTGTASLKAALEQLGFGPCHHMRELIEHPEQIAGWRAAAEGEPVDWEKVFAGYRATTDWPGASFWRQLISAYPSAKVILTVRDAQRWYDSAKASIYRVSSDIDDPAMQAMSQAMPHLAEQRALVQKLVWNGDFGGKFADQQHAVSVFEEHNAAVRREVAADRLLVYRVGQGWEPLCDFLGVDVPDTPFPHENDSATFNQRIEERLAELRANGQVG